MVLPTDDDTREVPRAARSEEDPERVTQLAFALASPTRYALFQELMDRDSPLSTVELAGRLAIDREQAQQHVDELLEAGLVSERRRGLRRERVFFTGIADLEIRFFGGKRTPPVRRRTQKDLDREAKRRERAERKKGRKEARIARKRAKI